jgi:hypothetical protein
VDKSFGHGLAKRGISYLCVSVESFGKGSPSLFSSLCFLALLCVFAARVCDPLREAIFFFGCVQKLSLKPSTYLQTLLSTKFSDFMVKCPQNSEMFVLFVLERGERRFFSKRGEAVAYRQAGKMKTCQCVDLTLFFFF